jgi:formamidopyrimidine-DNA glycosylase
VPELPEVERGRKIAAAVAEGRTIKSVWADDDPIVFGNAKPATIRRALKGRKVNAVCRHGKQLWFELDARPWPLFHFGMTGSFWAKADDAFKLRTGPKLDHQTWPPKFSKIHLIFEDGGELVMTNARRFGRILLRQDPRAEEPIAKLGFDPYLEPPAPKAFEADLKRRKATVKGLLLNQSFVAGLGNWMVDEILYQAQIAPQRPACSLQPDETRRIHAKLKSIVAKSVEVDADKSRFPKHWLFHFRWNQMSDAQTFRGEKLKFDTVAGRTTAWAPEIQK